MRLFSELNARNQALNVTPEESSQEPKSSNQCAIQPQPLKAVYEENN